MLETTVDTTGEFSEVVKLSNFKGRTFLLRRISAITMEDVRMTKKSNLGNVDYVLQFDSHSTVDEISAKEHLIVNSFESYKSMLKMYFGNDDSVKKLKKLEPPKQPTQV
jgi:hypothetical protein